jgi:hypothetical protein
MATANTLDQLLEPITACLTPQVARRIVDLQLEPSISARIMALAEKANAGELTAEEDEEYKGYVEGGDMIALLQAKARRFLAEQSK